MYILLFLIWVILSSNLTWEIFWVGAVLSVALEIFSRRVLGFTPPRMRTIVAILPLCLLYVAVLFREVLKSNLHIIRLVLSPRIQVEPTLISFCPGLRTSAARVALANSITLTPGTITVAVEGDEFVVHALDHDAYAGIEDSVFVHLLKRIEEKAASTARSAGKVGVK